MLDQVYNDAVRPILDRPSHDNPRLLILGGPQGSGKTSTLPTIQRQRGMTGAVRIDGDDIMAVVPGFEETARGHGGIEAHRQSNASFQILMRRLLQDAREARIDVILVGPYTHAEGTRAVIEPFRSDGYSVEMAYMGEHPATSELGVMHRHFHALQDGIGGFPPLADRSGWQSPQGCGRRGHRRNPSCAIALGRTAVPPRRRCRWPAGTHRGRRPLP
ncbi:zeta toxin family protein [Streptomyces sp. NPDC059753]|uniref:zeta toxin family protein n=1 Tax=Streptomyces sp. NPDC059753 TaxID=3346933 RepID=UPI003646950C